MMTLSDVMAELERLGHPQTKATHLRHGAVEPFFGVKVGDLKTLVKKIKVDHELALALYATGNGDAMYLAGLIADPRKMTPDVLDAWAARAPWSMISEYTVPWVAAESPHGWDRGRIWIVAGDPRVQAAGWNALAGWVALRPDAELDLPALEDLLARVRREIHGAENRVRYTMNGFVIAVGTYVAPLHAAAVATALAIGKVSVDMGGTACKVPFAPDSIAKATASGPARKRKQVRC